MSDAKKYRVLVGPIATDEVYQEGSEIPLTDEQAEDLLRDKMIAPIGESEPAAEAEVDPEPPKTTRRK